MRVRNLTVVYGGSVAIHDASFTVAANTICGLIGPNGAGKTTLFNCISGLVRPASGSIEVDGADLIGVRVNQIAGRGIARTFQNVLLFGDLTLRENVAFGVPSQRRFRIRRALLGAGRTEEREALETADRLLDDLGMSALADAYPGELPFGTLKRAELGRALASRPSLLLLDEPANGLSAGEVDELSTTLEQLRADHDLTVVLVEHHMGLVQRVADHAVVLDSGRVICQGAPAWVCQQPGVVEAYLGTAS